VVVDDQGRVTWMGAIPRLALLRPEPTTKGCTLRAPGGGSMPLPPAGEGAPCTVQCWNGARGAFDSLEGHDAGAAPSAFASEVAGKSVRIVRLATDAHRPNPVHVTTVPSLRDLAAHLGISFAAMSGHRRFRPNLVLEAAGGEPLAARIEDQFAAITRPSRDRSLSLEVTGRCDRCVVIDVDPDTGQVDRSCLSGTKTHSARHYPGEPAYFGVYARARVPGKLEVGELLHAELRR
jgi:hypothetical protein